MTCPKAACGFEGSPADSEVYIVDVPEIRRSLKGFISVVHGTPPPERQRG